MSRYAIIVSFCIFFGMKMAKAFTFSSPSCDPDTVAPILIYPSETILLTLDPCDINQPAIFFFNVSAIDECDPNPIVDVVSSSSTGASSFLSYIADHTYLFLGEAGTFDIAISATDESGNASNAHFTIEVQQEVPPVLGVGCNDTIIVNLNANCQRQITPDMLLEGEHACLPPDYFDIDIIDLAPSNGALLDGVGHFIYEINPQQPGTINGFQGSFAPGQWSFNTSSGGIAQINISSDTLSLTGTSATAVTAMPYSGTLSFTSNTVMGNSGGNFNILLLDVDGNLVQQATVSSDEINTFSWPVEQGYRILFLLQGTMGDEGAQITDWSFTYDMVDFDGLESCWGIIESRDERAPEIACPQDTDVGTRYEMVNILSGEIDAMDDQINTSIYNCLIDNLNQPGERYYELIAFEVDQSDFYTFFLSTDFDMGGGNMALFQSFFNPQSPCTNIIARANFPQGNNPVNTGTDPFFRIVLPLDAGATYYMLTTTDVPEAVGDYEYWILSDNGGRLVNESTQTVMFSFPLFCADVEEILNTDSLQWTGLPSFSDNCSAVSLTAADLLFTNGDCGDAFINRTFYAADDQGNTASCTQQITFRSATVDDVSLPPITSIIECDEAFPLDEFGNPSPIHTGFPFILSFVGIIDLDDDYCNIGAVYEDGPLIETCLLSYQFIRTWTIIDWCDPTATFEYAQIIKIGDFTPPELSAPIVDLDGDGFPDSLRFSAGPFECTAAFSVPLPNVSDDCSLWEVETLVLSLDTIINYNNQGLPVDTALEEVILAEIPADSEGRFVGEIPLGCHYFRYIVTDECSNVAILDVPFCVVDAVEPTAICNETLNASIGLEGNKRVFAVNVDENSWDNCGIDSLAVRRYISSDEECNPISPYYSDWANYVEFTCCEINTEVTLELLVVDVHGNENTCSIDVLVEDKLEPECIPPPLVSIPCDSLPYNFNADSIPMLQALFGLPQAADNCAADWIELMPSTQIDDCGYGLLTRSFQAIDESGNTSSANCQQAVIIEERHDYEIRFPKDTESNCGYPNEVDTITYSEIGCDLLAVSVEDEFFSASGDECFKIFRTYRVINWCEYDGVAEPQIISQDEDCDEQSGEEDVWVLRRVDGYAYIDRDNDENNQSPQAGEKGNICDGMTNSEGYWRKTTSTGFWSYTQKIKVYDTIPPQILYLEPPAYCSENGETCRAEVEYPFIVADNCTPTDLEITVYYDEYADGTEDAVITDILGTYPKYKVLGNFPIGSHEFRLAVRDGCGNMASAILPFTVADCLAPSPVCINGLAAPLMPVLPDTDVDGDGDIDRGALTVFATNFVASPLEDCVGPVKYSINRIGETPDPEQNALIVTCDDLGILLVEIYAWDAAFNPYAVQPDGSTGGANYDYCETFILVQNNLADCDGGMLEIAGAVKREDGVPLNNTEVQLSGDESEISYTDSLGNYTFEHLEEGYDYTITPFRDGDDQNGLSTYDIVLISNHILGISPIDSPYKLIAADVNNSGSISTLDIIQLRQVILSIEVEFPHSNSWRFVPAEHTFENPQNPWQEPLPTLLNYNGLDTTQSAQDFVAIKVGDIDLSAQTDNWLGTEQRSSAAHHYLLAEDRLLKAGETALIKIDVLADGIIGLQGELVFDEQLIELYELNEKLLSPQHWNNSRVANGQVVFSWHDSEAMWGRYCLFECYIKAIEDTALSDAMQLSDDHHSIKAEVYRHTHLKAEALALEYQAAVLSDITAYPNPFSESVQIQFPVSRPATYTLGIYDAQGRLCFESSQHFSSKTANWLINSTDLKGQKGLYYYQLKGDEHVWTGKLILQ
jgi:hypothetical protein